LDIQHLENALSVRAARKVRDVVTKIAQSKAKLVVTMNEMYAQDLIQMSKMHMLYLSFVLFRMKVESFKFSDTTTRPLLLKLAKIFALKQLTNDSVACYETGFFGPGSSDLLHDSMQLILQEIRPQMIPLVELNTRSEVDMSYMSCIGNEYGDIYETQLEWAMKSRFNKK